MKVLLILSVFLIIATLAPLGLLWALDVLVFAASGAHIHVTWGTWFAAFLLLGLFWKP